MKILRTFTLTLIFLSFFASVNGQENKFKGQVVVFDSIPLINAKIIVNSSKRVILTDSLGNFSFNAKSIDKIKVTADGFIPHKEKIYKEENDLKINLRVKFSKKAKEIAVKYVSGKNSNQFITTLKYFEDNPDYSHYNDVIQIIQRKFSGIIVEQGGIILRGQTSLSGSSYAAIEIDGMLSDFNALTSLSPSDVKSIELINSSRAALYGSRGGNGVVVIVTKGGK